MVSVCVWTQVSRIASRFFTIWTTREAHRGSYPVLTHNYNRCQRLKNILSLPSFLFDFVNSKLRFAWSSRLFMGIWRKPTFNTPNDQTHQWLSWYVYQQSLFQALFTKVPESISNWLGSAPTETGNWSGRFQLGSFLWPLDLVGKLHLLLSSSWKTVFSCPQFLSFATHHLLEEELA